MPMRKLMRIFVMRIVLVFGKIKMERIKAINSLMNAEKRVKNAVRRID